MAGLFRGRKRPRPDESQQHRYTGNTSHERDDTTVSSAPDCNELSETDQAVEGLEEVMKDNLEIMLEIIMRIREDPQFAKSVYADCPRLQHLLDQRPDLRPIFEDPKLVKISFEKAYKEAGGELPEEKKKRSILSIIVNHPLFKFFRFLIFMKKLMNCVQGGGVEMIQHFFQDMFNHHSPSHLEHGVHQSGDAAEGADHHADDHGGDDVGNPEHRDARESMYDAADRLEKPEMKEKLERIKAISDPEQLAEEIENDPELRSFRDSNDLCAELMSDPDTCKIILEPDNLRALGECPDLIDADLNNPEWDGNIESRGQEMEANTNGDNVSALESGQGNEAVVAEDGGDALEDENCEEEEEDEDDEEQEEEEEEEGLEFELGEEELENNKAEASAARSNSKSANKQASTAKQRAEQRRLGGGNLKDKASNFFGNIAIGVSDMVAGELVGMSMGDFMGDEGDVDCVEDVDDMDDMEQGMEDLDEAAEAADDAADGVDNATLLDNAADAAEMLTEDDVADNLDNMEDGLDHVEDTHEDAQDKKDSGAAGTAAAGGAAAARGSNGQSREVKSGDPVEEPEEPKKGRFQMFSTFLGSVATAAKETVATTFLGDDFGEMLVEKIEEDEEEEEDDGDDNSEEEEKDGKDGKSSKNDNADLETGSRESGQKNKPQKTVDDLGV